MILPLEGDEKVGWKPGAPKALLNSAFDEAEPQFSPDGRWIAYESDESGTLFEHCRRANAGLYYGNREEFVAAQSQAGTRLNAGGDPEADGLSRFGPSGPVTGLAGVLDHASGAPALRAGGADGEEAARLGHGAAPDAAGTRFRVSPCRRTCPTSRGSAAFMEKVWSRSGDNPWQTGTLIFL